MYGRAAIDAATDWALLSRSAIHLSVRAGCHDYTTCGVQRSTAGNGARARQGFCPAGGEIRAGRLISDRRARGTIKSALVPSIATGQIRRQRRLTWQLLYDQV